jgi:hypothetical protein
LFGKGLSHQGPRSLVAVNDEDLTLCRVHWQFLAWHERLYGGNSCLKLLLRVFVSLDF